MKKYLLILLLFSANSFCYAQQENDAVKIINSGKPIKDEMIFYYPFQFKKNKKPLFFVNRKQVECIAAYNKEELKTITVLQPKEAVRKYGSKGRNGVILVQLKDEVKTPEIVILTNQLHYICEIDGKKRDTTEMYYEGVDRKNCSTLDLRDTAAIQTMYIGFDNKIKVKNLGAGWDMTIITVIGGMVSGSSGEYLVRVDKEGTVKIILTSNWINNKPVQTVIFFRAVKLPPLKKHS